MPFQRLPNLHEVYRSGQPLGVECRCGRRQLLAHDRIGASEGNMEELRFVKKKLRCLGCGARPKDLRVFLTAEQARAWEMEQDQAPPRF